MILVLYLDTTASVSQPSVRTRRRKRRARGSSPQHVRLGAHRGRRQTLGARVVCLLRAGFGGERAATRSALLAPAAPDLPEGHRRQRRHRTPAACA